jgi:hypothetical protein
MAFAQLTYRESLRDIEACLRAVDVKLYHLGIRGRVSRNTLARANEKRDWRIFSDFGQVVMKQAQRELIGDDFGIDLKNAIYALDSTVIETCLSLLPWSYWAKRESKGGVKAHVLFDVKRGIPTFLDITRRKVHDCYALDKITLEPDAFYVMDRGYLDFGRLYEIEKAHAYFITRPKKNVPLKRIYSRAVDNSAGVRSDQIVKRNTTSIQRRLKYPAKLRRIHFYDEETANHFIFITNNFELPADTIAALYKMRWQVELFFKWIKQHLRIKKFYGNSSNSVKTQIWVAVTIFLTVALAKKRFHLPHSHYTILQVLSVTLFEKKPILQAFREQNYNPDYNEPDNQLELFGETVGQ